MKIRHNKPEWIGFVVMLGVYGAMLTKALLYPAGQ